MRTPPSPRRLRPSPPRTPGRWRRRTPPRASPRRNSRLSSSAGSQAEQLAAVEDPDPVRKRLRLREIVGAEEDRRLVRLPDLADELLHLELRARVEACRRLVEEQKHWRRQQRARERDLLLHAARQVLHRLGPPLGREADAIEDARDLAARLSRRHSVVARRVAEVLRRRHLLEEDASTDTRLTSFRTALCSSRRRARRPGLCRHPATAASTTAGRASTSRTRSGRGWRRSHRWSA